MKISIITATWNSAATVADTMESVLRQTYADYEHIIVDGGSTDTTMDIVRALEPRYGGRLRWVSERDRGIYDAMNKGLRMATGDVVGILNSDDFYSSDDVLARVAAELNCNDVDAVYGDIHYVRDTDLTRCVRYYSGRSFRRWMMLMGYQPAHPSFYCRRDVYDRLGGFDLRFRIAADFENMLRLIYMNRIRTHYLPMDFVTMRQGGTSTAGWRSHCRILSDHYRAYVKNHLPVGFVLDPARYVMKVAEVVAGRLKGYN